MSRDFHIDDAGRIVRNKNSMPSTRIFVGHLERCGMADIRESWCSFGTFIALHNKSQGLFSVGVDDMRRIWSMFDRIHM